MAELTDPDAIRAWLETDRGWALYALGDLAPEHQEHCRWFGAPDGTMALIYEAFDVPVFFAMGQPLSVQMLLDEIDAREMFILVRPEIVPVLAERYWLHPAFPMWRMVLRADCPLPAGSENVTRLTLEDLPALEQLYADDERQDGDPRFFTPSMLEHGCYIGFREGEALIAVAGTHLIAPHEGVGAIGNVYTRRDRRGRGLATQMVGAVVACLRHLNLHTIGLNVAQSNPAAIRVYERLGFAPYCPYIEAHATRKNS
jgi:RimJ/RimL family protein N-acetyltransferase